MKTQNHWRRKNMYFFVVALVLFPNTALAQKKKYEEKNVECVDCGQPVPD